jgi:hypothetical protein
MSPNSQNLIPRRRFRSKTKIHVVKAFFIMLDRLENLLLAGQQSSQHFGAAIVKCDVKQWDFTLNNFFGLKN